MCMSGKENFDDVVVCISWIDKFLFCLQIHSLDGGGEIGMITKQWTGLVRELFADAANFGITCKDNIK